MVFLCQDKYGNEYALKQIAKKSKNYSNEVNASIARKEIELLNFLNSKQKEEENFMIVLVDYSEDNNDLWLIFEKGGKSLSNLIFKIKGEFHNN